MCRRLVPGPVCALALAALLSLLTPPTGRRSEAQRAGSAGAALGAAPGAVGTHVVAPTRAATGSTVAIRAAVHRAHDEEHWTPLGGATVRALLGAGRDRARAETRTGPSGEADLRLVIPEIAPGRYPLVVETVTADGRQVHEGTLDITTGARVLTVTDKPLYQPGQTIHFRALALRSFDLKPLGGRPVTFEVQDPRGNVVLHREATLSRFGVASADLALAHEVNLGTYRVRAVIAAGDGLPETSDERAVKVARYVPPRFKVTITPDRKVERPGHAATGVVEARYFFGQPVAGGRLTLDAGYHAVRATLGADGTYRYSVPVAREASLSLTARVRDGAEHEEVAARALTVDAAVLHVGVVAEAGALVPGVENLVYVTAVTPDGTPVPNATVEGPGGVARTDEAGVATLSLRPSGSEHGRMPVTVAVTPPSGGRATHRTWLDVSRPREPAVLVRPARVIVPRGAPVAAEVLSWLRDGMAYLDVVKDGQILRSVAAPLRAGRAHLALPPDDNVFGTVSLRGEVVDGAGRRGSHERLVYVERRNDLKVEVTPDKSVHAPGEPLTLRFRTIDAQTGAGAPAQIAVVMADEAVLAMAPMRTGMERVFFTLARELEQPRATPAHVPHSYTTRQLVSESGRDALRDRVMRVLTAGATPPASSRWEVDPWEARRAAWRRQLPDVTRATSTFMVSHLAGVREGGAWRFRDDLVPAMVAAGVLPAARARDPWNRTLTPPRLAREVAGFRFDLYARRAVDEKQRRAYAAIGARAGSLGRERVAGRSAARSPHVWSTADALRLVSATDLIDPWGHEMRVLRAPRYLYAFNGEFLSRYVLTSAGPDGEFGTDDDVQPEGDEYRPPRPGEKVRSARGGALAAVGSGYGYGGLGLSGVGRGGGGHAPGIALGRASTLGYGGGARVRETFPETMLWKPDLVSDERGQAQLTTTLADSITTWSLTAVATAADGRIGTAALGIRVFQDFFVDVDLPDRLTQGDEIAVPVAVYNYQQQPAHVSVRLEEAPWFARLSDTEQALDLAAGQVGVRYFRIRALAVGRHPLTVHARGGSLGDAVRRSTEVMPDGVAVESSYSDRLASAATTTVAIPPDAIAGASRLAVKVLPGAVSQALDGLEGLLRVPAGCFEQTSSTTYPNALILDYLRRTGGARPDIVRRATDYLALGYQRLLSFEVQGGGFSWFGHPPANQVLTAYGLNEFHDLARVRFVDPKVIDRTTRWLLARQRADGGFEPDRENIHDGAVDRMVGDRLRTTAYIALALARSGQGGPALRKAVRFVRAGLARTSDPYTLALAADLFAVSGDGEARRTFARLWPLRTAEARGTSFAPAARTVMHGGGRAGRIETTALVAEALVMARHDPAEARQTLDYLIASKDAVGSWSSTQATIQTLRALLAGLGSRGRPQGEVTIDVDGARAATITLGAGPGDVTEEVDLTRFARPGVHTVAVRFRGAGEPVVQVVSRAYRPRAAAVASAPGDLRLGVEYDRTDGVTDRPLLAHVRVAATAREPVPMPVVEVGVPPGFDLDDDALERLVRDRRLEKFERAPGKLVLYLATLRAGAPLTVAVPLRPRMPLRVQAPASVVYEYYRPESRAESAPVRLTIRGG